jgi:uncharacterized membrane protein YqgA involved in biofilm formation
LGAQTARERFLADVAPGVLVGAALEFVEWLSHVGESFENVKDSFVDVLVIVLVMMMMKGWCKVGGRRKKEK